MHQFHNLHVRTGILLFPVGWYSTFVAMLPSIALMEWIVWCEGSVGKHNKLLSVSECSWGALPLVWTTCPGLWPLTGEPPHPWREASVVRILEDVGCENGVPHTDLQWVFPPPARVQNFLRCCDTFGEIICLRCTSILATFEGIWDSVLHEAWWMWRLTCGWWVVGRCLKLFVGCVELLRLDWTEWRIFLWGNRLWQL